MSRVVLSRRQIGDADRIGGIELIGDWSWRRFPTIAAAEAALAELRRALPSSYVASQNDPLITVGSHSRRGWSW